MEVNIKKRNLMGNTNKIEETTDQENKPTLGCRTIFILLLFMMISIITGIKKSVNNLKGELGGYVTIVQDLNEYNKIEKIPMGKEIGKIKSDTILRLKSVYKKGELTWIYAYGFRGEKVDKIYVCIPKRINIEKPNDYVLYNENSDLWTAYYEKIDKENEPVFMKYQSEFEESIKNIKITKGTDNIEKESIKKNCWILDKSGYMGLFIVKDNEFYYINKTQKSTFLKNYKKYLKKYESEKIQYF